MLDYLQAALEICRKAQAEGRDYGYEVYWDYEISICLYHANGRIFWKVFYT